MARLEEAEAPFWRKSRPSHRSPIEGWDRLALSRY
jgi:hypothetical protein